MAEESSVDSVASDPGQVRPAFVRAARLGLTAWLLLWGASCATHSDVEVARRVVVERPADLAGLRLEATDDDAQVYLRGLEARVALDHEASRYALQMVEPSASDGGSQLVDERGAQLASVVQLGRSEEGCAAAYPPPSVDPHAFSPHPRPGAARGKRAEMRTACPQDSETGGDVEGAESETQPPGGASAPRFDPYLGQRCGNIATIHSALQLEVLEPVCVVDLRDDEYLDPLLMLELDRFHGGEPGMTPDQIEDAHRFFEPEGKRFACIPVTWVDVGEAQAIVQQKLEVLRRLAELDDPEYDCTIGVRGNRRPNGDYGIKHAEHVKAVRRNAQGHYEIDTADGFAQGGSHAHAPSNPPTNTWEFGAGRGRLKQGGPPGMDQLVFEKVRYQCCALVDAPD